MNSSASNPIQSENWISTQTTAGLHRLGNTSDARDNPGILFFPTIPAVMMINTYDTLSAVRKLPLRTQQNIGDRISIGFFSVFFSARPKNCINCHGQWPESAAVYRSFYDLTDWKENFNFGTSRIHMRESRLDVDDAVCVIGSDRKMIFVRDLFNNRSLTDKRIVKQRAVEDAKRTPSGTWAIIRNQISGWLVCHMAFFRSAFLVKVKIDKCDQVGATFQGQLGCRSGFWWEKINLLELAFDYGLQKWYADSGKIIFFRISFLLRTSILTCRLRNKMNLRV